MTPRRTTVVLKQIQSPVSFKRSPQHGVSPYVERQVEGNLPLVQRIATCIDLRRRFVRLWSCKFLPCHVRRLSP